MMKTQLFLVSIMIVMAQAIDQFRLDSEWSNFKVSFFFDFDMD